VGSGAEDLRLNGTTGARKLAHRSFHGKGKREKRARIAGRIKDVAAEALERAAISATAVVATRAVEDLAQQSTKHKRAMPKWKTIRSRASVRTSSSKRKVRGTTEKEKERESKNAGSQVEVAKWPTSFAVFVYWAGKYAWLRLGSRIKSKRKGRHLGGPS
jgi:hypothetical protein